MSGLPPPPPSADLEATDPNTFKHYNQPSVPNQYQNEVLSQLNSSTDTNQQIISEDVEEVKNGSYNDNNSNDINDMKLSMECMESGQLPFGVCYEDLKFVKLSNYEHGIPSGLEGLKRRLIEENGLNFEGIFRLRGKEINLNKAKQELNELKSISIIDVTPIEVAQLIKAFYRSLPCDEPGYLPNNLLNANCNQDIITGFNELSEPRKSLFLWTFDLWIKIEEYKPKNKMTLQSMSIVFSPNMVRCLNPNPMVFLELQKKVQRVIHDAAKLRKENKLIISTNYNMNNIIIPFKKDRNNINQNASAHGPKYAPIITKNNDSNAISDFFKNCVLL